MQNQNTGQNFLLAMLLALILIFVGVVMMNTQAVGIDNHIGRVEEKVDVISEDVRLLKYGQQLLAAQGSQAPIVVTK